MNKVLILLVVILLIGAGVAFAGWDGALRNLQNDHPAIRSVLKLIEALTVNNPLLITFLIIFAIGTVPCIFVLEGWLKLFFLLLSLLCWGWIAGLFVIFYGKAA